MKILCIDTSTSKTSLGLSENETLLSHVVLSSSDHAAQLLSSLEKLLSETRLELSQIDAFAVVLGPGSFTGLRISLATVKGFCYVLRKPAIGLNALEALARCVPDVPESKAIYPVIHSRKGKVFTAGYRWKTGALSAIEPSCETVPENFFKDKKDFVLLGSALEKQPELFQSLSYETRPIYYAASDVLCEMAREKFQKGDFLDIQSAEPDYVVSQVASLV